MSNSQLSRPNPNVSEISGKPGQVWGNVVIPASGTATMKIVGDTLCTITRTSYGLEKREIHTRIQKIDSVELVEGRFWWLLILGIATAVWLIGIIFIVLFFVFKQQWIVIHSPCSHLILFYNKNEDVQSFCKNLLALSRQLNSPAIPRPQTSSNPNSRPNSNQNLRPNSSAV